MDKIRLIKICEMVAEDCKQDAAGLDGKPFNGRTFAESLGEQLAMIAALANTLKEVVEDYNNSEIK